MVKRGVFLVVLFFVLLTLNFYLILKSSGWLKKQANIQKILDEIAQNSNPQKQFNSSSGPMILGVYHSEAKLADGRVANLKSFFRKYNSVLYNHAEKIVEQSDKYGFDYRLLPSIAMQESNLCKYIPADSYNCWGWGVYGDVVTKFSSYDEAIEVVAEGIRTHYIDKGLLTASLIMEKYTPSSKGSWAHGVNTFLEMLE